MVTVRQLSNEYEAGLLAAHPALLKTVSAKLALAGGAVVEAQTPNAVELANLLPLETERQDMHCLLYTTMMPMKANLLMVIAKTVRSSVNQLL